MSNEGRTYRLPSEAEWEYACRAGTTTLWCCGNEKGEVGRVAWLSENSDNRTHPVGAKEANAWGLFDMHGNVWEWCADRIDVDFYGESPVDDPTGSAARSHRVSRGGGYYVSAAGCRSAHRHGNRPLNRSLYLGFRVAIDPSPEEADTLTSLGSQSVRQSGMGR